MTSLIPLNEVKIEHETYLLNDRYGPNVFHGILIDTGATGRSTAGLGQYKALQSLFGPHQLDKST